MLLKYLKVLGRRNFSLLWFGQVISQFGDRLTQIALVGLVSQASMSSSSLAFTMSMAIIPVFIISPISGVYVDRWSKRKTMYVSDLIRCALVLMIPLVFSRYKALLPVYLLIFLSFSAGRFFIPAKMAFIPQVIGSGDIFMANSLISITATVAAVIGIGLGGIIVERYGVSSVFYFDAGTFLISSLSIFLIASREKSRFEARDILNIGKDVVATVKRSFFNELREGFQYIFKSKETKYAFKIYLFLFSYIGGLYVVFIRFIQQALSSVTRDLGFTAVSLGAGIFLGSLIYGRIAHRFSIKGIINLAIFLSSAYLIFFAVSLRSFPSSVRAVIFAFILGIIVSPAFIGVNALIHRESDKNLLGRIFSGLEFTSHLGFLIAMFAASWLADIFNPFVIVVSLAVMGMIGSLIFIINHDTAQRT
ncbi:MAG: MFS transporter [Candidatus Omnitrophica bacterium]|nr:MFS transporter [Candidatus Omnitrophota bacterium]MDD5429709.1 MFS transporter [Candidatus Omnitrophota bacterium]